MSLESNSFGRSCTFHEYTLSFVRVAYDALFGTVPLITTGLFFFSDCFHIGFTLSTAHTGCAHEVWRVITSYDHHIFGWSTHDTPPHHYNLYFTSNTYTTPYHNHHSLHKQHMLYTLKTTSSPVVPLLGEKFSGEVFVLCQQCNPSRTTSQDNSVNTNRVTPSSHALRPAAVTPTHSTAQPIANYRWINQTQLWHTRFPSRHRPQPLSPAPMDALWHATHHCTQQSLHQLNCAFKTIETHSCSVGIRVTT